MARNRWSGAGVWIGWLGILGAGCSGSAPTDAPAAPDIVLITLDTLRADRLGCYGDRQADTPQLDALARDGVRFADAITPVPLTLPAHASLLSGLEPTRHGVLDNAGFRLATDTATLAQALQRRGYATAASVAAFVLDRRFGLEPGFDRYGDRFGSGDRARALLDPSSVQRRANAVVDEALATLATLTRPFFLWLHFYDPHLPYDPPSPERERFSTDPYRGEIAFADRQLGRLLEALRQRELYQDAVILVAGDHGEDLGQHGEPSHGVFLYDTTLRVPLILKLPRAAGAGSVRRDPVGLIDVAPTLAALAQAELPSIDGRNLLDPSSEPERMLYAESRFARRHFGWSELFALRSSRTKLVSAPRPELYDLEADPGERNNLAAQQPQQVARLQKRLDQIGGAPLPNAAAVLDAEERAKLAALGYLGSDAALAAPAGELADPKDQIDKLGPLLSLQEQAVKRYQLGDYRAAIPLLEQALELEPRFIDAHAALADCWLKSGALPKAVALYRGALKLSPDDATLLRGLETALELSARRAIEAGRLEAALDPLEELIGLKPQDAELHFNYAKLQQDLGRARAALEAYARAARLAPLDTKAVLNGAILQESLGEWSQAEAGYREVLARDPSSAPGHFLLARMLSRLNKDPAEASQHLERAYALDPSLRQRTGGG